MSGSFPVYACSGQVILPSMMGPRGCLFRMCASASTASSQNSSVSSCAFSIALMLFSAVWLSLSTGPFWFEVLIVVYCASTPSSLSYLSTIAFSSGALSDLDAFTFFPVRSSSCTRQDRRASIDWSFDLKGRDQVRRVALSTICKKYLFPLNDIGKGPATSR
jgi:hypothetical protein